MSLTPVVFTVLESGSPLSGVDIYVYSAGGSYETSGQTGALGELSLLLNGDADGIEYTASFYKQGYQIGDNNSLDIQVIDPPGAGDNIFELAASAGEGDYDVVSLRVLENEVSKEGVALALYSSSDEYHTTVVTGSDGVSVLLPSSQDGETYLVRFVVPGAVADLGPTQVITVTNGLDNSFDFEVTSPELPESLDPLMCRVTGRLINALGHPYQGPLLVYPLADEQETTIPVVDGGLISGSATAQSGSNGEFDFLVPRGQKVLLRTPYEDTQVTAVVIPDVPGVRLEDLRYPYIKTVTPAISSVTGDEGSVSDPIEVSFLLTDYTNELSATPLSVLVSPVSTDTEVATVALDGNILTVAFVSVGTATINFERIATSSYERLPSVAALEFTAVEVTVQ